MYLNEGVYDANFPLSLKRRKRRKIVFQDYLNTSPSLQTPNLYKTHLQNRGRRVHLQEATSHRDRYPQSESSSSASNTPTKRNKTHPPPSRKLRPSNSHLHTFDPRGINNRIPTTATDIEGVSVSWYSFPAPRHQVDKVTRQQPLSSNN